MKLSKKSITLQQFALVSLLAIFFSSFIIAKTIEEDVVIIGSGFGGSIMAYRLSQIGVKVTILEKGREWKIKDPTKNATFPLLLTPDERAAWFRNFTVAPGAPPYFGTPIGVSTGLLEYISEEVNPLDPGIKVRSTGVSVNNGIGVGGGSLIYNAAIVQPTEENFNTVWDDPMWNGLYSDLEDSYWPKVTNIIKQSPIPDSILNSVYYKNARVFQEQANNAGFDDSSNWNQSPRHALYKLNLGIDWDVVQEEIEGKKVSAAIAGEIWYGINSGAKFSLDRPGNYLDLALSSSLVTLQSLHLVDDISYDSQTEKYSLHTLILDQSTGDVVDEVTYLTKKLIMSAGSVMTSSLLVRAKGLGKLDKLTDEVGKGWGNNGDAFGFRFASEGDINPAQGGPASFGMAFDDASDSTILMNIPVKWGPANNLTNIIGTLSMGIPHPSNGVFSYDSTNDVVTLAWPTSPRSDEGSYNAAQEAYAALNNANPGTSGQLDPINSAAAITGHPMGGVVYGKATDFNCKVKGYEGLYVVDGSLVPGAAGTVNPAFVVAGMAELCAEKIISAEFADYYSSAASSAASSSSSAAFLIPSSLLFFILYLFV